VLTGNSAVNILSGNAGNDTLDGKGGADQMSGGTGDDVYVVDNAGDVVNESPNEGTDTVQSSIVYTLGNDVENLTLTGTAGNGTGNASSNVLIGNSSGNTLTGLDGNDTLDGGSAGTDTLIGGLGDDTYVIGRTSGITITENSSEGTDTVQASVTFSLTNVSLENLTLTGNGAINGTGNAGANVLIGNGANNSLTSSGGNDTLTGGGGNDTLNGGDGADNYNYASGDGADTINNSSSDAAQDRLNFTNMLRSNVTFAQSGNDLLITHNGVATDSVRVTNWFSVTGNQLDFVQFTDQQLTNAQINSIVSGGPGFQAGGPSASSLITNIKRDRMIEVDPMEAFVQRSVTQFVDAMNHFEWRQNHLVLDTSDTVAAESRDMSLAMSGGKESQLSRERLSTVKFSMAD
jgi:hypothetical protein